MEVYDAGTVFYQQNGSVYLLAVKDYTATCGAAEETALKRIPQLRLLRYQPGKVDARLLDENGVLWVCTEQNGVSKAENQIDGRYVSDAVGDIFVAGDKVIWGESELSGPTNGEFV